MKHKMLFLFAVSTALLCSGQEAAATPPAVTTPKVAKAVPTERNLADLESLELQIESLRSQLLAARSDLLDAKYHIKPMPAPGAETWQEESTKLLNTQKTSGDKLRALAGAMCKSVGVPEDKMNTECFIDLGMNNDGTPLLKDGKPVAPTVKWVKPTPPPAK